MNTLIDTILRKTSDDCFDDTELRVFLASSADRRYGLVKRALQQGSLLRIRRGLYCLPKHYRRRSLDVFELAQRIYAPSYISFETALSYHELIPEGVYTVTSASVKRSRDFDTPLGRFSFNTLPQLGFFTAVSRVPLDTHRAFLMANPWKAILDLVYTQKKNWPSFTSFLESMRIEFEDLEKPENIFLKQMAIYYKNKRVSHFIQLIEKAYQT